MCESIELKESPYNDPEHWIYTDEGFAVGRILKPAKVPLMHPISDSHAGTVGYYIEALPQTAAQVEQTPYSDKEIAPETDA